jgi:chromosome segregation ATPase
MDSVEFMNNQLKEYIQVSKTNRDQGRFNAMAIEIINANIEKFNQDFKAIENSFATVNKQHKIFHDELKSNKNIVGILSKERIKNTEFNERVNNHIVNIQIAIEKLESNKNGSPKENDERIHKIDMKLNHHSQKLKQLDKLQDNKDMLSSLKNEIITLVKKEISDLKDKYEARIDELHMKNDELLTEFRRINNEFENLKSSNDTNKNIVKTQLKHMSNQINDYDEKQQKMTDFLKNNQGDVEKLKDIINVKLSKYNEDISNIKETLKNMSSKSVQDYMVTDKLKERISNIEQQIIYHINLIQENKQHITYQGSLISNFC